MEPVLSVIHASKSYNGRQVVSDINFSVYPGEIFALIGPNGAGKTTILECIEGLRSLTTGKVSIFKVNPYKNYHRICQHLGIQLQSSALPFIMTVEEALNIFSLYLGSKPKHHLLERFALADKRKVQIGKLSTGQLRKLVLAIALSHEPKLIILDEPTAGLDVETRRELHQLIKEERDRGAAIILTSHDMSEVEGMADRVAILAQGKIIAEGSLQDILLEEHNFVKLTVETKQHSLRTAGLEFEILEISEQGNRVTIKCEDLEKTLLHLLSYIKKHEDQLVDLKVERATLEERFVEIIKMR